MILISKCLEGNVSSNLEGLLLLCKLGLDAGDNLFARLEYTYWARLAGEAGVAINPLVEGP